MGRRSAHTPEQLRELIISSARDIISTDGLSGVSAREIARKIGYSPGTLYNLFESLDDLLLHVEARLLDALDARLVEVPAESSPDAHLKELIRAYTDFCRQNPNLCNLVTQHSMPRGTQMPAWYLEKLDRVVTRIEAALAPLLADLPEGPQTLKRTARVVWAAVQGIITVSTPEKLSSLAHDTMGSMTDDFVTNYVAGLKHSNNASIELNRH